MATAGWSTDTALATELGLTSPTAAELAKKAANSIKDAAQNAAKSFNKSGKRARSMRSMRSKRSKRSCYLRKQKRSRAKKRVCLDAKAVIRRSRGGRKGGKRSH